MDAEASGPSAGPASEPVAAAQAPATERQVAIENFTFSPARLVVPAGSKVVWRNRDDVPHTVVATGKGFASKALDTDDEFSHVFATAGTFAYFCGVHPHMTGEVVVQ
jgi:plastocyanin